MHTNNIRYVGVFPADGGDLIGFCVSVNTSVSLESQIEQSISKLGLTPGEYIAIAQVGVLSKTKTLTNFTVYVPEALKVAIK